MSRFVKYVLLSTVLCASLPLTASAAILADAIITNTNQLQTKSSNPYFNSDYASQKDVAGVNFNYGVTSPPTSNEVVPSGTKLLGIGFDNVFLGSGVPGGSIALVQNPYPITLTLNIPGLDASDRTQTAGTTGTDSAVLNIVAQSIFYRSTNTTATMTFSGLDPNGATLVQVIGGDSGWNADFAVTANGSSVGTWTTVADNNSGTASLFSFTSTANGSGDLQIVFTATAGNFAGIAGIMLSQAVLVPEPSSLLLLGLGACGLVVRTRRRRLGRQ